jgi:hypothetical protein
MPLFDTEDASISLLRPAEPPGRLRTSAPRKAACIRGRVRQPSDAADQIVTIDGRTHIGKVAKQLRDGLVRHVGGQPTAVELAVIERCIQLKLRIAAMDLDFAATGTMSSHATKSYLAWSNSFVRALNSLGLEAAPAPTESLASIVGTITARKAAQAAPPAPAPVPIPPPRDATLPRHGVRHEPDLGASSPTS